MLFSIDAPARQRRLALIEGASGRAWTYGELASEVSRLARVFEVPGLVFLFCRNDLSSVAWYLAAVESGHAVALLNERLDAGLKDALIDLYRPEFVVTPEGLQRHSPAGLAIFPELSLLLSTSGSTGSPKLVRLTRAAVEANADGIRQALGITAEHRPVAHLPIHYSYGLSVLNSHLLAGATVLLTEAGLLTADFWTQLRQYNIDSFSGVPYTYQMLRRLGLEKAPALRILTQAGGKLDNPTIAHFHKLIAERGGTFWVMYGQTEATARITVLPASDLPLKLGSAGRALPGGSLRVGADGELIYSGPNVMLGYAESRQDLEKGDELSGVLRTGDKATLDADGYVQILGRAKRDAKIFGLRVNLDELEAFVRPHGPAAAVAGAKGVVLFCEFDQPYEALLDELANRLKIHKSAFEFRHIERLPTKDSGKMNYEELQKLL